MAERRVRLHIDHPLGPGQTVPLSQGQAHYLGNVLRLAPGAAVRLFNGQDGEWRARLVEAGRRGGVALAEVQEVPQGVPPDVWLMFAPVKKAQTDFIVEKAVELGAGRIMAVATDFTNAERVRADRLQGIAVEAAEQCGATWVPRVEDTGRLARLLDGWDPARRILWADEGLAGGGLAGAAGGGLAALPRSPWAVLTGPEGGFSPPERVRLAGLPFVVPVRLGPRILRAETAALAALVLWQAACGDWR
ncbi:MAG: 16S rRNA (uracil(1498)-N(3))-methyltransferase [Rhodobacteraceae bacterium]|nr:16S rRNA (uracil(1498)-N(3))-methyltransferase [Paracoccaceae bacterium]